LRRQAALYTIAECAIEACHALIDLRQFQRVASIVKRMGEETGSLTQVLTAETGGDLLTEVGQYQKAIGFYRHALDLLARLPFDDYGYRKEEFVQSPLSRYFKARIEKSLSEAERLLAVEKYGKGFVLYQDAERLRRHSKSFLGALLAYQDIGKEFPKTVYSEASAAYSLKCLLALSNPANRKQAIRILDKENTKLAEARKSLSLARRAKAPKHAMEKLEYLVSERERRIQRMKAVLDLQEKTLKEARETGNKWIKQNTFGLYRGEAIVGFAKYALEEEMDPDRAFDLFTQAWKWLSVVERADAKLDGFSVPSKARAVSAPPPEEKQVNFWGKVTTHKPSIGAIVNRRTCSWYLDELREQCALLLGFLHFCKGENEEAINWYAKVPELDQVIGRLDKSGEWNDYRRLKWGAEHGYLYAHPCDLDLLSKQQRFAVLQGDFYYVTERFSQAQEVYHKLLNGRYGKLQPKARNYPHYAYATCLYWTKGRLPAYREYLKVIAKKGGTLSTDRAIYAAGNISRQIRDKQIQRDGSMLLKRLATSRKRNEFALKARLLYALKLIDSGSIKKGLDILKRFPRNKLGLEELADYYVKRYEQKTKMKKDA